MRGKPVKLTDRYAAALNKSPRTRINWRKRRGVVAWVNSSSVAVVWDGRRSIDILPHKAVEMVET
jgi:hypothetical protein